MAYTAGTIGTDVIIQNPAITQGSDLTGDVYYRDAAGKLARLATGADGTVLTSAGAGAVPAFETVSGTTKRHEGVSVGTGTSYVVGSIPSSVTTIWISLRDVSIGSNGNIWVQVGDASSIKTTGYTNATCVVLRGTALSIIELTTGFVIYTSDPPRAIDGEFTLSHTGSDVWVFTGLGNVEGGGGTQISFVASGRIDLPATLTQFSIGPDASYSTGTNALDSGYITVRYA